MYTSSYSKNIVHATSNGLNSFRKTTTDTVNYSGTTRIAYQNTIPSGGSVACRFNLEESYDYFVSFSATNANGVVSIKNNDNQLNVVCNLDSNNNYSVVFAAYSNLRDGYLSSDPRYELLGNDIIDLLIENGGTTPITISMEKLTDITLPQV